MIPLETPTLLLGYPEPGVEKMKEQGGLSLSLTANSAYFGLCLQALYVDLLVMATE